ncbi:unnamed protein product, partial [Symbiodinium microadriaticum]
NDSDDEEMPDLVEATPGQEGTGDAGEEGGARTTRGEKKSRKAMAKLGMRPVSGINRVTIRKSKNILFSIAQPDVFKSATSDTYIIFGEAKVDDLSAQAQSKAAEQFRAPEGAAASAAAAPAAAVEDEGDVDDEGVDPKDIDLVIAQIGCSRAKAVTALKNNDNDVVNAIMELTM